MYVYTYIYACITDEGGVWGAVQAAVQEERPLYLFDKHFGDKCPELLSDYTIPPYFADDLLYEQRVIAGGVRLAYLL